MSLQHLTVILKVNLPLGEQSEGEKKADKQGNLRDRGVFDEECEYAGILVEFHMLMLGEEFSHSFQAG